ncbi:MAG TPA: hypothetical protein VNX25_03305, partial [Verrucomicrobiae bacterium]|nr:hypothetical protein [Verrucomicrobiae bacterium]
LLHRFAAAAQMHFLALELLDEEGADAHARVIIGLYRSIAAFGESGRTALLSLTDHEDPVVAGMAAVYSLRYDSRRSLETLGRISSEEGLLGFRARVALERWESGEWRGPEE